MKHETSAKKMFFLFRRPLYLFSAFHVSCFMFYVSRFMFQVSSFMISTSNHKDTRLILYYNFDRMKHLLPPITFHPARRHSAESYWQCEKKCLTGCHRHNDCH